MTEVRDPSGPLDLRVLEVVEETGDARSLVLEAPAGLTYKPGQFLTLAVPSEQTGVAARCYSLSSAPHETGHLQVTVKRTADGYASNWICDNVRPGTTLTVLPPSGIFTPADLDADLLLFAGGSGITPVMSIVKSALTHGSGHLVLVYANRDESSVIFARELAELSEKYVDRFVLVHWLESLQGLPTADRLRPVAEYFRSYDAFVCGPGPFMGGVVAMLKELGFPRERRHQEKFVSLGGNPFGDAAISGGSGVVDIGDPGAEEPDPPLRETPARVVGDLDGEEFALDGWDPGTPLLDFLLSQGVGAPYSCREGNCSACACIVTDGEVSMRANDVLDADDLADGIRLACQSLPVSDEVRITYSG
ncbi:ferredoxin--NADP reductase [Nocardioides sp. HDW12B]|uniref:ferredoxin--NADP reductase n=1 Tax=Nocardioides sp. HDW12B TaxID=2714939 RepID=UPI00140B7DE4|nr:ferredoxin--NADP reductase [Nocardioides sp. HDW12B]QIK66318.1 ferredoxin--NADP reductase [Nocardioides sp. HDW12B]